jgi:hypothetical protein
MDRGDSGQTFGDIVDTLKECIHEVFDAVFRERRGSRGDLPVGAAGGRQPASAVSAFWDQPNEAVHVAGSLAKRRPGRTDRTVATATSITVAHR